METLRVNELSQKLYQLTLSADYLKHWTVEDAVRELFQNAIDFSDDGELDFVITENRELQINTKDVSLNPSVLLLGSGDKSEDDTKLGGFGEGMKVALLILAREGIDVVMYNGDKIWRPKFLHNEHFGTKMLCIEEEDNLGEDVGIRYTIKGLHTDEIMTIIDRTLPTQSYEGFATRYGEVLKDDRFKSKIFVGGLYVCNVAGLNFGYNFNKGTLPLNRDRQTVPDWEVSSMTNRMVEVAVTPEEYVKLVAAEAKDVYHARYQRQEQDVCEVAHEQFVKQHGKKTIANSESQAKALREEGYIDTYIETNDGLYNLITSSKSYEKGEKVEVESTAQKIERLFNESELETYVEDEGNGALLDRYYDLKHLVLDAAGKDGD